MKKILASICCALTMLGCATTSPDGAPLETADKSPNKNNAVPSVAKQWNEVLLNAIRHDFARPVVHARNLFHHSALNYDIWAVHSDSATPYLAGGSKDGVSCHLEGLAQPADLKSFREEAISYASYRLITHRFDKSPGYPTMLADTRILMRNLGYDYSNESKDYRSGGAAALGNYLADCYIRYGFADGANEANDYANQFYRPVNPAIEPELPGNPTIIDRDRWQTIELSEAIDQAGNPIIGPVRFVGPEWGKVTPFALPEREKTTYRRGGFDYDVYYDPGAPPSYDGAGAEAYKWGFSLVSVWSSQLDPNDGVMMDISPASLGNIQSYPSRLSDYHSFYNRLEGGDPSTGYKRNPITGRSYSPQIVPRADYARVLAEFWADGPDSETPPGHWFVIINSVMEHPDFHRRFAGKGAELDPLEYDVKAYFALGGAMHDAAIAAWGIKGWYDYLRPVSAIRSMAEHQSSDPALPSYDRTGIALEPGYVELVQAGDPLAGAAGEHIGKIKLYTWRGPDYIDDPLTDIAGVGWILAENWWPYQRPTFVTPPFAGYISGHSTYSRAAAEVLTALTGSEYFPGGMSNFHAKANEFLVFEKGPSMDVTLQWAKYQDAADQCSLSRIWGGIHPPADDIPGRIIGEKVGQDAFNLASDYILGRR